MTTLSLYRRSALWRAILTAMPEIRLGPAWLLLHDDGAILCWRSVQKWEWRATP